MTYEDTEIPNFSTARRCARAWCPARSRGPGISQRIRSVAQLGGDNLDETRRLLYMALLRQRTEKYELAGTLVNALVHHQSIDLGTGEVIRRVLGVIEDANEDDMLWMQGEIDRISMQLGD